MRFRKLRIAWSVAWGLAAVLLIALLVRSFRSSEAIHGDLCGHYLILCSSGDNFFVVAHTLPPGSLPNIWRYTQPALTTVVSPAYELGQHAGKLLLERLKDGAFSTNKILLPVQLQVSGSTQRN